MSIEQLKDDYFNAQPYEKQKKIANNYFDSEIADDYYKEQPPEKQAKMRDNFLKDEGFIDDQKELTLNLEQEATYTIPEDVMGTSVPEQNMMSMFGNEPIAETKFSDSLTFAPPVEPNYEAVQNPEKAKMDDAIEATYSEGISYLASELKTEDFLNSSIEKKMQTTLLTAKDELISDQYNSLSDDRKGRLVGRLFKEAINPTQEDILKLKEEGQFDTGLAKAISQIMYGVTGNEGYNMSATFLESMLSEMDQTKSGDGRDTNLEYERDVFGDSVTRPDLKNRGTLQKINDAITGANKGDILRAEEGTVGRGAGAYAGEFSPEIASGIATGFINPLGISFLADTALYSAIVTAKHGRKDRGMEQVANETQATALINASIFSALKLFKVGKLNEASQKAYQKDYSELTEKEIASFNEADMTIKDIIGKGTGETDPKTQEQIIDEATSMFDDMAKESEPKIVDDVAQPKQVGELGGVKIVEDLSPTNKKSEAAKARVEKKRLEAERMFGPDEDAINEYLKVKKTHSVKHGNLDDETIEYMDQNTPLQPSPPVTKEEIEEANKIFAIGEGNALGGSLGGATLGGTEAAYQDIVEGKDVSMEEYLAKIGAGAAVGAVAGKYLGGKEGTASFVGGRSNAANQYPKTVAQNVDEGFYSKLEDALNGLTQRKNKPINKVAKHDLIKYLKKKGITNEELEWSGFNKQVKNLKTGDHVSISDLELEYPKFTHYENDAGSGWTDEFFEEQVDEMVESEMSSIQDSGEIFEEMDNIYYNNGYEAEDLADFKSHYSDEIEALAKEKYGDDWEDYINDVAEDARYDELESEWYQTKEYNEGLAYQEAEDYYRNKARETAEEELQYRREEALEEGGTQYGDYAADIGDEYTEKRASVEHPDMEDMYNPNGGRHWDEDNNLYHSRSELLQVPVTKRPEAAEEIVSKARSEVQAAKDRYNEYESEMLKKYGNMDNARQNITPDELSHARILKEELEAANKNFKSKEVRNQPQRTGEDKQRLFIQEIQSDHHQGTAKYNSQITEKDKAAKRRYENRLQKLDTAAGKYRDEAAKIKERFNEAARDKVVKLKNMLHNMIKSSPDINKVDFSKIKTEQELLDILTLGDEFKGEYKNIIDLSEVVKKQQKTNKDWYAVKNTINDKFKDPRTDAPYKKTWWQKAIKDQIQKAIDNGYDEIAFNTSSLQNGSTVTKPDQGNIDFYDHKVPAWVERHLKSYDSSIKMKKDTVSGVDMHVFELTDKVKSSINSKGQSIHSSPTAGSALLGGAIGGIDTDENGKMTFDPQGALTGAMVGGALGAGGLKLLAQTVPLAILDGADVAVRAIQKGMLKGKTIDEAIASWLKTESDHKVIDAIKKAVVQDYRLSDQYLALADEANIAVKRGENQAIEIFDKLKVLNEDELSQLHNYVAGESDEIASNLRGLANSAKKAITLKTKELVSLGLLPEDILDVYKKGYLHREYEKHIGKAISDTFFNQQKKLSAQYKRGKEILITKEEYNDLVSLGEVGSNIRDAKYVKDGEKNGKIIVRRDWTKAEREEMGEIVNASYTVPSTIMKLQRDIAYGKFLAEVATDPSLKGSIKTADDMLEIAGVSKKSDIPAHGTGYQKLSGSKYGKLDGLYVEDAVANDIKGFKESLYGDEKQVMEAWKSLLTEWKVAKTVKNPTAHMNNFTSNMVMSYYAGIAPSDIGKNMVNAINEIRNKGKYYKEAEEIGLLGRSKLEEIRRVVDKPVAQNRTWLQRMARNIYMSEDSTLGTQAYKMYSLEDDVSRLALYTHYRKAGKTEAQAMKLAGKVVFDYTKRMPPLLRGMRDYGIVPFVSWTYKAIPLMFNTLFQRPSRYASIVGAYVLLDNMINDGAEKPEFMRGKYMTVQSNNKESRQIRTASMTPFFDWITEPAGTGKQLGLGGIPQKAIEGLAGRQFWNDQKISYREGGEKALDYGLWTFNSVLPTPAYLSKVYNIGEAVAHGGQQPKRNKLFKPRTVGEATAGLFGVNVRTYDKREQANRDREEKRKELKKK